MQLSGFDKTEFKQETAYVAAALSVVPGLGQIYNGEVRKGFLFLCSGVPSLLLVALICHKGTLVDVTKFIAASSHVHVNSSILKSLNALDLRSPQTILLCLLLSAFIFFCIKDASASDHFSHEPEIDSSNRLKISEATCGSYVLHAVLFTALLLLGLFLFMPPDIKKQAVEIEFTSGQLEAVKPHASALSSKKDLAAAGNVQTNQSKQDTSATKRKAKIERKLETRGEKHPPALPQPPQPSLNTKKLLVSPRPFPSLTRSETPAVVAPLPQPTKATPRPVVANLPQPLLASSTIPSQYCPAPLWADSRSENSAARIETRPTPASAPVIESMAEAPAPIMPADLQESLQQTNYYFAPRPQLTLPSQPLPIPDDAPWTINLSSFDGEQLAPDLMAFDTAGNASVCAPRPAAANSSANTAPPSIHYCESAPRVWLSDFPNYGPYVEQVRKGIQTCRRLQPTSLEHVVVSFKIHVNGQLTDLHINESHGDFDAAKEALKAVEYATLCIPPPRAPEMILWTLPKGSEEQTEIKFTFEGTSITGQVVSVKN